MKRALLTIIALALTGCQMPNAGTGAQAAGMTRRTAPTGSHDKDTAIDTAALPDDAPLGAVRVIDPAKLGTGALTRVQLVGKVKLISDKGAGIVSNHGGGLVSNNSGNYALLADGAQEALLADARIDVVDAEGKQLVGADGTPIGAVTDEEGHYALDAQLPKENFVLRIRLFPSEHTGGELLAVLPNGTGSRTLDVDTASSLGASYVLDRYVKKRQDVFNRLPASEVAALERDMREAAATLTEAPSYETGEQAALVEDLRAKTPALDATLERIKALLLAGQQNLGNGLAAVNVALTLPVAIAGDEDGNLYITEGFLGRVRKVTPDGTISVYPSEGAKSFGLVENSVRGPDGSVYIAATRLNQVWRIKPDGTAVLIAGNGKVVDSPTALVDGQKAVEATLSTPNAVALGPDGTLYIGEDSDIQKSRLLEVGTDGLIHEISYPEGKAPAYFHGLAVQPTGELLALDNSRNRRLMRRKADGTWETLVESLAFFSRSRVMCAPDGMIYVSESGRNHVFRIAPDGTMDDVIAPHDVAGYAGDGGQALDATLSDPSSMYLAADGTLYICDTGNSVLRAVKDGVIRTVAGVQGMSQIGDALSITLNGPAGVSIDPQGRLVVAEGGSSLIKRLDGSQVTVIAGTTSGYDGDGGSAAAAKFKSPGSVAYAGDVLYVLDSGNEVVRRIGSDGVVTTVAGHPGITATAPFPSRLMPADTHVIKTSAAMTTDAEGRPVWTDSDYNALFRLNADGQIELVAGSLTKESGYSGDGGPAAEALLKVPGGVACDEAGNIYFADSGNLVVRKIDPDGVISTIAGTTGTEWLGNVLSGKLDAEGSDAREATFIGPGSLCLDKAGNLYVAELGMANLMGLGLRTIIPPSIELPNILPRIRKITPDGKIYTVAGPGSGILADETGDNRIGLPSGLAIDGTGRLIISDLGFNQLKLLPAGSF